MDESPDDKISEFVRKQVRKAFTPWIEAQNLILIMGKTRESQRLGILLQELVHLPREIVLCSSQDLAYQCYDILRGLGIPFLFPDGKTLQYSLVRYPLHHGLEQVEGSVHIAGIRNQFRNIVDKMNEQLSVPVAQGFVN